MKRLIDAKIKIFIPLLIIFIFSSLAYSGMNSKADLDNLRGFKWGTHISKFSKNLIFKGYNKDIDCDIYWREKENFDILGVPSDEIQYVFFEKKFMHVYIFFRLNDYTELIDLLSEYFGKDGRLKESYDKAQVIWSEENTTARFTTYKLKNDCELLIGGVKQILEKEKKQELKKKEKVKKGL